VAKTDTCAFCGYTGTNFDPEHWAPQWLSRELIPRLGKSVIHNVPDLPSWEAKLFEIVLPHVCKTCNNHWLSDLESSAKPHVLPFILGNSPDPMTEQGMKLVASWCYLKAISLELGRNPEHRPTHDRSVYRNFKQSKVPPYPNCSLALGYREIKETNPVFLWWGSQGLKFGSGQPGIPAIDGYHTTVLIGHLVIDVFGTGLSVNVNVEHGEGFHVLWPTIPKGETFNWPPEHRFRGVSDDGESLI
jgi:hypothetical protein